jgi:outer membrane protein assembly complex protein YaeT
MVVMKMVKTNINNIGRSRRVGAQLLFFLPVLILAFASEALAIPWEISQGVVSDTSRRNLKERHPDIASQGDLMRLLQDMARKAELLELSASHENGENGGRFLISGRGALTVGEIDIQGALRDLRSQLRAMAQNIEGQVDTPALRDRVRSDFTSYLNRRGFFGARVTISVDRERDYLIYNVRVQEGEPCVIEKIDMGLKLPFGVQTGIVIGDICDEESLRQQVDRLLDSLRDRGYNQARIELAGMTRHPGRNTATVHVGGILGKRIRYQVNDKSQAYRIGDLFGANELSGIDPTIVGPDAMGAELVRRYRSKGFNDVAVTGPKQERKGDDELVYVYDVDPGPAYSLRGINFEGSQRFPEQELLGLMNLQGFWQNTSVPLDPEAIRNGVDAIRIKYQAAGFWDAVVRDRPPAKDRDAGVAQITIVINEGIQRILGSISVRGAKFFDSNSLLQLPEEEGSLTTGSPVDRSILYKLQQAIRTRYFESGYLYTDVKVDLTYREEKKQIKVDVVIEVFEGNRVKIGNISVSGLARTKPKVVLRELRFESGEWYDPGRITESRRALVALGLFRAVQILPMDRNALSDEEPELDILVDVREGKAGTVSFGPGWSLADGYRFNTEATYNNLGGLARQVSVRAGFSQELRQVAIGNKTLVGRNIGAGYVEPYVFDLPFDFTVSAANQARATETAWELSRAGEVAISRKLRWLGPAASASLFYGQKVTRQESDYARRSALLSDDVRVGVVGIRANIDRRNDPTFPTRGWTLIPEMGVARFALGGDLRYLRTEVNYARYIGLRPNFVFAFGVNLATYQDVERKGEDRSLDLLPPSERLYVGGADSVRGFRERSLGPLVRSPVVNDDGVWNCNWQTSRSGGSRRIVFKFEGRYRFTESLAATGFLDNGNVFFSKEEMDRFTAAFADPVEVTGTGDECIAGDARRTVEDNNGYSLDDLKKQPGVIWSKHYASYGTAINFLTAIGSVNIAYGLPLREPKTSDCQSGTTDCYSRGKQEGHWLTRGEFHLNVGARF